jgi:hypothetical protein
VELALRLLSASQCFEIIHSSTSSGDAIVKVLITPDTEPIQPEDPGTRRVVCESQERGLVDISSGERQSALTRFEADVELTRKCLSRWPAVHTVHAEKTQCVTYATGMYTQHRASVFQAVCACCFNLSLACVTHCKTRYTRATA